MTTTKFSGRDLEITMDSTAVPCAHIRAANISEKINLIDSTGACDDFVNWLPMRSDVDVTLELLDSNASPSAVFGLFAPNPVGQTLIIYPQGNRTGKPKYTCTDFVISGRDHPINYADVVTITVTGKASGGFAEGTV
jgi:hypothetical protein